MATVLGVLADMSKIIRKIIAKYGTELTGDQYYQVYSTYGLTELILKEFGITVKSLTGFGTAKMQHSQDSNILDFKFWKEGVLGGTTTIDELVEDGDLTEKQAVSFMRKLCLELVYGWPDVEIPCHISYKLRASSFVWLYQKVPELEQWMIENANTKGGGFCFI